jgi:nitrous oxidase accessory protein
MIDAAPAGGTVVVPAGNHMGGLVIDRPLTLIGDGSAVLDGMGAGSVLTIAAPDVTVRGLVLRGSGTSPVGAPSGVLVAEGADRAHLADLVIERSYLGITVQAAADVLIERVRVTGEGIISGDLHAVGGEEEHHGGVAGAPRLRGDGIWLFAAVRPVVRDSVISHVRDGVYLTYGEGAVIERTTVVDSRYAVHDMYASNLALRDNDLIDNLSGCVLMYGGPVLLDGNAITESGSPSTGFGVLVKDAGDVVLRSNVIADNRVGLHIDDAGRTGGGPARVEGNTFAMNQVGVLLFPSADAGFTGNGFVENTTQVAMGGGGDVHAVWSSRDGGNYWSDYGGVDADGDGLGDLPYVASGRVSELLAEDPQLIALSSGPAFSLLAAAAERFAPGDAVENDPAPLMEPTSPPLGEPRAGTAPLLWVPGALGMGAAALIVGRARRGRGGSR